MMVHPLVKNEKPPYGKFSNFPYGGFSSVHGLAGGYPAKRRLG